MRFVLPSPAVGAFSDLLIAVLFAAVGFLGALHALEIVSESLRAVLRRIRLTLRVERRLWRREIKRWTGLWQ